MRGFRCAIKTNVLPHSLITGTLKTPNKTKHSVLKITEESLKLEHPALENVRYKQAGWTSAIYMTSFFYNRTCQNEDIRGAAYHQIHSASEKSPFSVKIHEVCNHDFSIKRCSFCDEVAQRHQIYGPFFHILQIYPEAGDLIFLLCPASIFQSQMRLLDTFICLNKSQNIERWVASSHSSSYCDAIKSLWMPNFKFLKLAVVSDCHMFQFSHK